VGDFEVGLSELDSLGWLLDGEQAGACRALLARSDLVVPVVGAGISKPAGYPLGGELADKLRAIGRDAGLTDDEMSHRDPRFVASTLIERGVVSRPDLLELVGKIYAAPPSGGSAAIDALLNVQSRRIVTLNYDRSLELRAADLGIECETLVLTQDGREIRDALTAEASRDKLLVIHAHGVADSPTTIALDQAGYAEVLAAPYSDAILPLLFLSHRLVFMGTQLDEAHFLVDLLKHQSGGFRHLLVASRETMESLVKVERAPIASDFYGLLLGEYPNDKNDHSELVTLIQRFGVPAPAPSVRENLSGGPELRRATQLPDEYVDLVVAEKRDPEDDELSASYLVAFGLRPPVSLEELATAGTRTLVEGAAGSGKSTLLLAIGSRLPEQVVPVKLRAPALDLVGDPTLLLAKWLERGEAFGDGERPDASRLSTDNFHFLIDALDEVPVSNQLRVVQRITEVARANAVHSFTVASRRVPALEGFARPEWVRVVIATGPGWRDRYLEKRGVTLVELHEACPPLSDLGSLLELPYFLEGTVDLFQAGALAEASDLLALVGLFVDTALKEVDETFPRETVREWLKRLSLAMVLAGTSDITIQQLADSLPSEFADYGAPAEVAERFVSANLLRASDSGQYGFVHKLIGETLAAEALLDVDPETSGVLDVAAPSASTLVHGLRTDWLVPITLVATKDESWRAALSVRDPLAGARTVPRDASLEERKAAAELIWDQYLEWQIWLGERGRVSIVDDQAVLVRLIEAEGLDDLQGRIREALDEDRRTTVGNALRVLADLSDSSIEPQVRRILETTNDDVIARLASVAARDLGLDRLFYVIAHRAINALESTEVQTTTYSAIDLAQDEDLIAFARRAARAGGEAIRILSYAIRGRVTARDELAVLRLWASRQSQPYRGERERLAELLDEVDRDDSAVAEDALFIACAWNVATEKLEALVKLHPDAAASAVSDAVRERIVYPLQPRWILELLTVSQLERGGASDELMDGKKRLDEWRKARGESE
jgi:hypothetical protein